MLLTVSTSAVLGQDCENPTTQREMNLCARQDFQRADSTLNSLCRSVIAEIDEKEKELLREAEEVWIEYRNSHCRAVQHPHKGGSMLPLVKYSCLKKVTDQRIEVLRSTYREELRKKQTSQ